MAKLVHVGDRLINLDSIDYVDLNYGTEREVILHFRGSERTLSLGGDDVEDLKEYLASEQIFDRTAFV
jgi:hypothetical protein